MRIVPALALIAACAHAPAPAPVIVSAIPSGDHVAGGTAYHVAGSGSTCFVIPGGPGLSWQYVRMPKLEAALQLVYVEPIGTGGSPRLPAGDPYTLDRYAQQLESLRVALHVDKMCLIGHSHGGEIAIHYAAKHPDRVSALVTVATPSHGGKDADDELAANLELWNDRPWFADAKRQMLGPDPKSDTEAAAQWLAVVPFLFADWDAHAAAYRAAVAVPAWAAPFTVTQPPVDLRPELGAITSPALVIVGAHDFCCGDPAGKDLARGISGAQLERFEHSGHMAYLEEPDQFATAVIAFVSIALEPPRPTSATDERSGRR